MNTTPRRAVVLTANIQADTRDDLVSHLLNLATRIERGEVSGVSISGGCSSGHVIELLEGDGPSHDEYFMQINAHLKVTP